MMRNESKVQKKKSYTERKLDQSHHNNKRRLQHDIRYHGVLFKNSNQYKNDSCLAQNAQGRRKQTNKQKHNKTRAFEHASRT